MADAKEWDSLCEGVGRSGIIIMLLAGPLSAEEKETVLACRKISFKSPPERYLAEIATKYLKRRCPEVTIMVPNEIHLSQTLTEKPMVTGGKIYLQMPKIMAECEPIAKDRRNESQKYNFRGVDDVYAALQEVLAKHGVFTMPYVLTERTEERQTKAGSALIYRILKIRYRFYADDGSYVDARVIGEGMDSGDKASNKAMSVAHKYALLQAFAIPTEGLKDPENESHDVAPINYDNESVPDKRWLKDSLEALKIDQGLWKAISTAMDKKPRADLQTCIDLAIIGAKNA